MGKDFTDKLKLPVDAITKILDTLKPLLATLQALTDCFHGPKARDGILPFLGYALEFATPLIRAKEPPLPLFDGMIDELIKVIQAVTRQISQGAAGALASLTSTLKTITAPLMLVPVLRLLLKLLFEVLDHAGDCYQPGIVPLTLSPLPFTIPTALFITIPLISTVLPTLPITQFQHKFLRNFPPNYHSSKDRVTSPSADVVLFVHSFWRTLFFSLFSFVGHRNNSFSFVSIFIFL